MASVTTWDKLCEHICNACLSFQLYWLVVTCATNLSVSSSCNKSVKIRFVATCHLQTCSNLLKQLAASLWITSFLQSTCNKPVHNLQQTCRQQAVASHANLLITSLLQDVNRLAAVAHV